MAKPNLLKLQEKLQAKVEREYSMGFEHIRDEIERKRSVLNKLFDPSLPEWQVRIPLFKKNMELENALFLNDEINIEFLTNWWAVWEEVMKNANLIAKYDDIDMDLYELREDIVNYNWLYGLAATIIDNWDDDEQQPIADSINPLNLIIDPKNYKGSKLRFIWVRRRLNIEDLKNNKAFDTRRLEDLEWMTDTELTQTMRSQDDANKQRYIEDNTWLVDIYDHFTVFEWKKVLTTWCADRTMLIRYIELEPLTKAEQLKPTKVKFPIQLHRRKPRMWSVFWFSIADEVIGYQDIISQLTNLQIINARINALWPDIFVDDRLWVDTTMLWQGKPGWRVLPITNDSWMPTQNGIFSFQTPAPSQYTDTLIQSLEQRAEETTSISKQNFWITQQWQQTKAEVQTLQQNANNILGWIANNYLRWQKDYWTEHYRSYAVNMSARKRKSISMFQKWNAVSLELKKEEFIADWKVQVTIISKNQQTIENDKEFNKLTFISNLYLPNITSEYSKNELLRLMWNKSNIRDFDSNKYIRESIEEIRAKWNLLLLNRGTYPNIYIPTMDEDVDVYIDIYKQAMDTPLKVEVMSKLYQIKELQWEQANQLQWVWNAQAWAMSMNNINQQAPISANPWI